MEKCQYMKCDQEATTKGFVLTKNPDGGAEIPMDVIACDKHKKKRSFFEYRESAN